MDVNTDRDAIQYPKWTEQRASEASRKPAGDNLLLSIDTTVDRLMVDSLQPAELLDVAKRA